MTVYREVLVIIGVGGMGQAIARRLGPSKTVLLADNNEQVLASVADSLSADGYDVESQTVDVIAPGGAGVVIASMAGHMFPPLSAEQEKALAHNPPEELLTLDLVRKITEPNFAYPIAKQANLIRVRGSSAQWGRRGARINSISPGVISTPMGQQELASPVGDGMRAMIAMSGTGRIGTPDDIAAAAAFLLGSDASFITGTDLLVDGGVIAAVKAGTP